MIEESYANLGAERLARRALNPKLNSTSELQAETRIMTGARGNNEAPAHSRWRQALPEPGRLHLEATTACAIREPALSNGHPLTAEVRWVIAQGISNSGYVFCPPVPAANPLSVGHKLQQRLKINEYSGRPYRA